MIDQDTDWTLVSFEEPKKAEPSAVKPKRSKKNPPKDKTED